MTLAHRLVFITWLLKWKELSNIFQRNLFDTLVIIYKLLFRGFDIFAQINKWARIKFHIEPLHD
jgi:hypothetical protein